MKKKLKMSKRDFTVWIHSLAIKPGDSRGADLVTVCEHAAYFGIQAANIQQLETAVLGIVVVDKVL